MFCPQCKAEYRAGFTKCSDCDVDLVKELPVDPQPISETEHPHNSWLFEPTQVMSRPILREPD